MEKEKTTNGGNIMEWLVTEVFSLLLSFGIDKYRGIRGKIRAYKLKKDLKKELFYGILNRYGDEVYYNDLDNFLSRNNVISKIIENAYNTPVSQYKSKTMLLDFYINRFVEEYPHYSTLHFEIKNIIQKCFEIVFNCLNKIDDEATRKVCNVIKELSFEILSQVAAMHSDIKAIEQKITILMDKNEATAAEFDYAKYIECMMRMYPSYAQTNYIERQVFSKENEEKKEYALNTLVNTKRVLLLGDAGFGKTFESINLLRSICKAESFGALLPIYLPLMELGTIYNSISEGIAQKMRPYCSGSTEEILKKWVDDGKLVLILDGIDDITEPDFRTKFFVELKQLGEQYGSCYFFVTSRLNRYHGGLDEYSSYYLTELSDTTILTKLREEGINTDIPRSYYQLFKNPLFLKAGIAVLKENTQLVQFNRSTLLEKLIELLYGEWDQKKGIVTTKPLCCAEIILLIGNLSYQKFNQASYRLIEFEQRLVGLTASHNNNNILGAVLSSGIFRIADKITFTHKLFKEYCVAYYLFTSYPFSSNKQLYCSLIQEDEWKEVFIFIAGLFDNIRDQDAYLDFVMENNLPLYIECVKSKSDLVEDTGCRDNISVATRYLTQIHNTYTYIVSTYFAPIWMCFDPKPGKIDLHDRKVAIRGHLSDDSNHLVYWFDLVSRELDDVELTTEGDIVSIRQDLLRKQLIEQRNIGIQGINLKLSGLEGYTGRAIAIDKIKHELKEILKKRKLIESKYLLVERVSACKKKIKDMRNMNNLQEMQAFVDSDIEAVRKQNPDSAGYRRNNIDMFGLQRLLAILNEMGVDYLDCILPPEDQRPTGEGACWVWDLFSDEQKIKRVSKFFYFHQLSYVEMVDQNFPMLKNSFSRYMDSPYQTIVRLDLKKEHTPHDYMSHPSLQYYDIASPIDKIVEPQIQLEPEEHDLDYSAIHDEIENSYRKRGRTAHRFSSTQTSFSMTVNAHDSNMPGPLSEYVYNCLRVSLEAVFGKLQ